MTGIKIYDPYTHSYVEHDSDAFTTLVAKLVIDERNRWLGVLDKIRAEIESAYEDLDGYDPDALPTFVGRVEDIIDKYKEGEED